MIPKTASIAACVLFRHHMASESARVNTSDAYVIAGSR